MKRAIIHKAERERLMQELNAALAERATGAARVGYGHEITTRYGKLWASADVSGDTVAVHCRFDEPERARNGVFPTEWPARLNPYSGKWHRYLCPQGRYPGLMGDLLFQVNLLRSALTDLCELEE
jgi:hypothetical protein